jgi:hypothetical protein
VNKGLVGANDIGATVVKDTSYGGRLSSVWVGSAADVLKIFKTTSFGASDLYFTTTVTLENTSPYTLSNVQYMRNVDPDQEQVREGLSACLRRDAVVCVRDILCLIHD